MTRRLRLAWLALMVVSLVLGACAPAPAAPTAPTSAPAAPAATTAPAAPAATIAPAAPAPSGDKTTITYWHVWGGARLPLIETQIADFQALNPDIVVEHTLLTQDAMAEKYLTAIAGGTPPDVMMIHGQRHLPSFASNGVLMALDDLLKRDGINGREVWFPAEFDTYVWNGTTYALPYATGTGLYLLFWNKDHFAAAGLDPEKPPTTWTEMREYAEKLTVKGADGNCTRMGIDPALGAAAGNYIFREWTFLNNGNIISQDGKQVLFNSPEGLEALNYMVSFHDDLCGGFEKSRALLAGPGEAYRDAFFTEKSSMVIDGVWVPLQLATSAPNIKWGLAEVPYNDKNPAAKERNIVEGGWGYAIPVGVKNVEAAWKFLKYVTMDVGNLEFFKGQSRPSPVQEYAEDPFFAESNPYWSAIQEAMKNSEWSPASPVQAKLNEITVQMVEEALLHIKTPEEALKWAADESQKAIDEWWSTQK